MFAAPLASAACDLAGLGSVGRIEGSRRRDQVRKLSENCATHADRTPHQLKAQTRSMVVVVGGKALATAARVVCLVLLVLGAHAQGGGDANDDDMTTQDDVAGSGSGAQTTLRATTLP